MTNVLTNPDRFFAELSAKDTKLMTPFAIVLVSAIVAAISAAMMMDVMASSLPKDAAAFAGIDVAIGAIRELVMPFIWWLLCAGVVYAVSTFFDGDGSFKRTFEFVGYSFIPSIIGSVIGLAGFMVVFPNELLSESFQQMYPLILALAIIYLLLMLWSVSIWIFAVKHARNLSTKHAVITVLAMFFLIWGIALIPHITHTGYIGGI
ncbi:MAG: YIP1 family protein [Methanosarcinales archaeon]|nr:MAG: YIP1 family protein [Methanosarcinales archaeon]